VRFAKLTKRGGKSRSGELVKLDKCEVKKNLLAGMRREEGIGTQRGY